MKIVIVSFLFFTVFNCNAQLIKPLEKQPDKNSLLWEITGQDIKNPSYLFGTFHLMCKDDIHFSNSLIEAIRRSDTVFMELKMDDPNILSGGIQFITMKNNRNLKELFTKTEYKKVADYFFDTLHISLDLFNYVKPFFLEAMLYPKMISCAVPSGVEEELLILAKSENKPISGLETLEFQASVFDSIPYKSQAIELLQTIDSLPFSQKEFKLMADFYKNQQLEKLNELTIKTGGITKQYEDILLYDRNKHWINEIKETLRRKSLFIAVGVGHLSGEKGLIAMLKQLGYILKPIKNY